LAVKKISKLVRASRILAEEVVTQIANEGGQAEAVHCDVSQKEAVENLFKSIKEKQNKKKVAASAYVDDPELNAAICSFVESRKKLRKPMTDRAIELFISRVQKIGGSLSEQIDLINTAVEKGWLTVYPKSDKEGGWTVRAPAMTKFSNFEQRENNLDEFALAMAKKQMEVLNP